MGPRDPMELARGSVADRPWGMTLGALGVRRATGQLTLQGDGKPYCIVFDHGAVVGASSPLASDAALRVALINHLVAPAQVTEITRRLAAGPERDEIEVLADAARLTLDQTLRLRRKVIEQRAARTFSIDRGEFVIDSDVSVPVVSGIAIDARAVIYAGARMNLSAQRLADELRPLGAYFTLADGAAADLGGFGFGDTEAPIVEALRGGTSLPELEAKHREIDPRTAQAVVYALVTCRAAIGVPPPASVRAAPRATGPSELAVTMRRGPNTTSPSELYSRTHTGSRDVFVSPATPRTSTASATTPPPSTARTTTPLPTTARTTTPPPTTARTTTPLPTAARTATASTPPGPRASTSPPLARTTTPPATARTMTSPTARPAGPPGDAMPRTPTPTGPHAPVPGGASTGVPLAAASTTPSGPTTPPPMAAPAAPPTPGGSGPTRTPRTTTPGGSTPPPVTGRSVTPTDPPTSGRAPTPRAPVTGRAPTPRAPVMGRAPTGRAPRGSQPPDTEPIVPPPPANAPALAKEAYDRGAIKLRQEELMDAIAELQRAVELQPKDIDYAAMLAWARFCAAGDKQALAQATRETLARALRKSQTPETPRFWLGRVERMLGRDKEALRHFYEVLDALPKHADAAAEVRIIEARLATGKRK